MFRCVMVCSWLSIAAVGLAAGGATGADAKAAAAATTAPLRVIVMSPGLVEMAFAIGGGPQVVGVSQFTIHPAEATSRPICGGFANPNFEVMLGLEPDLIIVQGKHAKLRAFCRARNINVAGIKVNTLDDVYAGIEQLGRLLGREPQARARCAAIKKELARLAQRVEGRPRPKVFVCPARQSDLLVNLMTAGKGSFLDELVTLAGGKNIFGDLTNPYPQISKESLLTRRPEIILELRPGEKLGPRQRARIRQAWAPLASIPAVRKGRIEVLTDDGLLIPGPRVTESVARIQEALFPELQKTVDRIQ